jgi:hypothetical protein
LALLMITQAGGGLGEGRRERMARVSGLLSIGRLNVLLGGSLRENPLRIMDPRPLLQVGPAVFDIPRPFA